MKVEKVETDDGMKDNTRIEYYLYTIKKDVPVGDAGTSKRSVLDYLGDEYLTLPALTREIFSDPPIHDRSNHRQLPRTR